MYPFLREPKVIVTSHLRRCLQTAVYISESLKSATENFRIIANPDLQDVSVQLCDTGSPLDVLREEFPAIEFRDDLFPDNYPRLRHIKPEKKGTEFNDEPHLLAKRADRVRRFLSENLAEKEIIVITHWAFGHYLFNRWSGEPGKSYSGLFSLQQGQAHPCILPETPTAELKLSPLVGYDGPLYSGKGELEDWEPDVYAYRERDCGIFTNSKIRDAVGSP